MCVLLSVLYLGSGNLALHSNLYIHPLKSSQCIHLTGIRVLRIWLWIRWFWLRGLWLGSPPPASAYGYKLVLAFRTLVRITTSTSVHWFPSHLLFPFACPFYFEHFRPCYFLTLLFSVSVNLSVLISLLPSNTLSFHFVIILLWLHWYLPSPSFSDSFSPDLVLSIFTSSYPRFLSPFRPASSDLWTSIPCFWIFSVAHPDMILGYSDSSLPSCLLVLGYH